LHEGEVPVEHHVYMTNLLGNRAVETIEGYARTKEPFLLSLHFTAPHWPWEGPDDEEESKRIRNIFHRDGTYMKMMQSLDGNIGRVLQALDVNGLAENTIVVFTSDNGGERFSKIWPFTGMKGELLEGVAHPGDRALARPHRGRRHVRAGDDHHGLDADAAHRRRHPDGPKLSGGR
jgi:arylsulfatase A-like enzyme